MVSPMLFLVIYFFNYKYLHGINIYTIFVVLKRYKQLKLLKP